MNLVDAQKAMIDGKKVYNVEAAYAHYIYFDSTSILFKYVDLSDGKEETAHVIFSYGTFAVYEDKPKLETKVIYYALDIYSGLMSADLVTYEEAEQFARSNTGKFKIEKIIATQEKK